MCLGVPSTNPVNIEIINSMFVGLTLPTTRWNLLVFKYGIRNPRVNQHNSLLQPECLTTFISNLRVG